MTPENVLTCTGVGLGVGGGIFTFKNFSVSFLPGAYVVLYGSNGIGTTTLLKMMAGVTRPTLGSVTRTGTAIYIENVPQLYDKKTVMQNLRLWADGDDEVLPMVTAHFSLDDMLQIKCSNLSPGEKKRVYLAKLLINRADIWLLDRPFEQLDDHAGDDLLLAIAGRINNNGTVICSAGIDRELSHYEKALKIKLDDFWDAPQDDA